MVANSFFPSLVGQVSDSVTRPTNFLVYAGSKPRILHGMGE